MQTTPARSKTSSLVLIGFLFFIFGFITWLNGTLIPFLKTICELNHQQASLVTFAFFISYFVMALPSSAILRFTGYKKGMSMGLGIMAIGCLIFIPAAMQRTYNLFLLGLFTQGLGLSILQTASNPYVTILGPIESAARRISIMGICNKIAGFTSPIIFGALLLGNLDVLSNDLSAMHHTEDKEQLLSAISQRIVNPYLTLTAVLILAALFIWFSPLPDLKEETDRQESSSHTKDSIWAYPHLFLGTLAIFTYVGVEVLAGDYIISLGTYLQLPLSYAKYLTSLTLFFMIAGYFVGVLLTPRYISQENLLKINLILSLILTLGLLSFQGEMAVIMLALLGFTHAIMWPAIWPMSLKDLGRHTKTGSALLIMGIAGGAIIPLIYGYLSDVSGNLQLSFWIMIPCYLYMLYFAVWGHKIRIKK